MPHPIVEAAAGLHAALAAVADTNPTFMTADDKALALTELARAEARVVELRLRVLADAEDVASPTGARDAAAWFAHHTLSRTEDARADQRLAAALERRYPVVREALANGYANYAQAKVIIGSLDALPSQIGVDTLELAQKTMVAHCAELDPHALRRLGRHILHVIAPDLADEAEARLLADLDTNAQQKTKLTLRRQGDGTTRLLGLLPDAAATRLATYLEAFTNPRKHPLGVPDPDDEVVEAANSLRDPVDRLPYPRRLGQAFVQLLECLDPERLPIHGGEATTVVVTLAYDKLRDDLTGAGDLLTAATVPGDAPAADQLSPGEVRRLVCNAHIVPAVLGAESEILDLGRSQRLFSRAQRRALLIRDRTCRAAGCDNPGTWAEAHHWIPWSRGGNTDLDDGVLLCSHHHQRAHDPAYDASRLPNGDVRFNRRT